MTATATDLLFDGYERSYHQIQHIRLRVWKALLGAEQQMITETELATAINALPLVERCRQLAVTACKWGMHPGTPELQQEDGTVIPATPEREFSIDAKTTAVMMMATNSKNYGNAEAHMALATVDIDPKAMGEFDGMVKMVAMARMAQDDAALVALALRERGEVKSPHGEWLPLSDVTEQQVKRLPIGLQQEVRQFLNWEQGGWPVESESGKPPAAAGRRGQRSTSK